ncbi:hypothetical protein PGTUg99_003319 [Puccinia graminis f. sp. tritici]|uniref:Uncharacterized protein n=1 Tax=Puccinia graminis f. sp. tritici TaxID=56615 RepID=A0A5B0MPW1_PUCGR|nr:hypothetical protein PGTUg99_003319 [Puccinia graminis f. sp. tritici]
MIGWYQEVQRGTDFPDGELFGSFWKLISKHLVFQFLQFAFLQGFAQGNRSAFFTGTICVPGMVHFPGSGDMGPNLMKVLGGNFLLTRLGTDQIYQFLSSRFFQGLVL